MVEGTSGWPPKRVPISDTKGDGALMSRFAMVASLPFIRNRVSIQALAARWYVDVMSNFLRVDLSTC